VSVSLYHGFAKNTIGKTQFFYRFFRLHPRKQREFGAGHKNQGIDANSEHFRLHFANFCDIMSLDGCCRPIFFCWSVGMEYIVILLVLLALLASGGKG
jgi:hypothetical protein